MRDNYCWSKYVMQNKELIRQSGLKILDKLLTRALENNYQENKTLVLIMNCDHPQQMIEFIEKYQNLTEKRFQKLFENKEE